MNFYFHYFISVPYQNNGCDCGVFVCRYAFSLLRLRNVEFKFDTTGYKNYNKASKTLPKILETLITHSEAFRFQSEDMIRLRSEFAKLIDNLSDMYKKEKELEKKKKLLEKQQSNLGKETQNVGGAYV